MKQGTHILSTEGNVVVALKSDHLGVRIIHRRGDQEVVVRLNDAAQTALKELLS